MIHSFADKETAAVYAGLAPKRLPRNIIKRAKERLDQLHAAVSLKDLQVPPSNRLEALKGDRKGQWSIRVNDQWRVCFRWRGGEAFDVEIVDYH